MGVLSYILDGLEAELALERELGVRAVEIDRSLLTPAPLQRPPAPKLQNVNSTIPQSPKPAIPQSPQPVISQSSKPEISQSPQPAISQSPKSAISATTYDFVFLHDQPLTGAGAEMISKITAAMGRSAENAPVIVDEPRPAALIYVVLGDRALKKWFPGFRAGPGMWITGRQGEDALVTYSPNYILRFGQVTPAVKKIKSDMWQSLKGVQQRLALKRK